MALGGLSKVEADKKDVFWEGLWRCLAFFTAVVKALHSIHCEAPPQISPQKSKHKQTTWVIGGAVCPAGKCLKTQNVH